MNHWTLLLTALIAILAVNFFVAGVWNSTVASAVPQLKA